MYGETIVSVQDVNEDLLGAVRSDPKVVLVQCEIKHVHRWYDREGKEVFPNVRFSNIDYLGFY
jgi:hypothetical protein